MSRIAGAVLVALSCLLPGVSAGAQNRQSDRIERIEGYIKFVRTHEPGDGDTPVYSLSRWSNDAIRALWLDVQTMISFVHCTHPKCRPPTVKGVDGRVQILRYDAAELRALHQIADQIRENRELDEILKRAAILHADVVMIAHPKSEPRVDTSPRPPIPQNMRQ